MEDTLLTLDEAASQLKTSRDFVLSLIRSKRLAGVRMGWKTIRIPQSQLDIYIENWLTKNIIIPKRIKEEETTK